MITGPCTTFALLIKCFPDVIECIDSVVIMGGSLTGVGNITPYGEFNVYCCPESFKIVMESPLEKTIFALEPLEQAFYDQNFINQLRHSESKIGEYLASCYDIVENSYEKHKVTTQRCMYDAGIVPWFTRKFYSQIEPANYTLTLDGEKRGQTIFEDTRSSKLGVYVAKSCDRKIWMEHFFECFNKAVKMEK